MKKEALTGVIIKVLKINFLMIFLSACQVSIPPEALQLPEVSLEDRQIQTRKFDTKDEGKILAATASVLQDLGFNLDESETDLGVVVGSKDRDAVEGGQVVGALIFSVLLGAPIPYDYKQKMRASIITRPGSESGIFVRVTFQRIVWNTENRISKLERLNEPKAYQEFFSKLSKAVFLEAHKI